MFADDDLRNYCSVLGPVYSKALDDVKWRLEQFMADVSRPEIGRIFTSSQISQRVKTFESILRKCLRDGITELDEIPSKAEDILGIRIATANKVQARELFEYLQQQKGNWFCQVSEEPRFVPYTTDTKNSYSAKSGYQAFHVTFVFDGNYTPMTNVGAWPVEIQIMSQLWEFWADYSRRYFYGASDPMTVQLLPYNVVISKILDSADDLIVATTDLLLKTDSDHVDESDNQSVKVHGDVAPNINDVRAWFERNLTKYFGAGARVPAELFLSKVTEELKLNGLTLTRLSEILEDESIQKRYEAILQASRVSFLPPYQQILCKVLLSLGWDEKRVVERVNDELRLIGLFLIIPDAQASEQRTNEKTTYE